MPAEYGALDSTIGSTWLDEIHTAFFPPRSLMRIAILFCSKNSKTDHLSNALLRIVICCLFGFFQKRSVAAASLDFAVSFPPLLLSFMPFANYVCPLAMYRFSITYITGSLSLQRKSPECCRYVDRTALRSLGYHQTCSPKLVRPEFPCGSGSILAFLALFSPPAL